MEAVTWWILQFQQNLFRPNIFENKFSVEVVSFVLFIRPLKMLKLITMPWISKYDEHFFLFHLRHIFSNTYTHNKFTIQKQRQDEKDMLEAI